MVEKNKRILKYGLIFIVLLLAINVGFSLSIILREPVFLKVYNEEYIHQIGEKGDFEDIDYYLYYITNVNDTRRVSHITFDDVPEITASANEAVFSNGIFNFNHNANPYKDKIYGRYALRRVYIRLNLNNLNKDFDSVELNNISIEFNNGDILEQDLGRFIIYNENDGRDYFKGLVSGSSSDGTSNTSLEVKEDIELIKIDTPILEKVEDYLEISVGRNNSHGVQYNEIEGMTYKAGDKLYIESKFYIPERNMDRYNSYHLLPRLYFKDRDGKISSYMIYNLGDYSGRYNRYYYSFTGLLKYLRSRGQI